jgi:hypothetical protein
MIFNSRLVRALALAPFASVKLAGRMQIGISLTLRAPERSGTAVPSLFAKQS